jgi:GNAT superfamily N-acetyltransferase
MNPVIRRAGPQDAETLARISRDTFVETWESLYSRVDLEDFLRKTFSPEQSANVLADPDYAAWLLEDNGEAIGHALAGPCGLPHPDVRVEDGELKRLYLLKHAHNGGWGARLFETALEWLERDGPRRIWLSVYSQNHGAQRFYARGGFAKAGEYEYVVGLQRDREFIFRREARAA